MPDQLKPCPFEKATTCSMDETCEGCEIWAGVKAKYDIAYKAGEAAERERCIRAVEEEDEGGCSLGFAMGKKAAKVNIIARIKEEKQ